MFNLKKKKQKSYRNESPKNNPLTKLDKYS